MCPTPSIWHAAAREGASVLGLYRDLYKGSAINFDLTCGGSRFGFKFNADLSVRSYRDGEFSRTLSFRRGGEEDAAPDITDGSSDDNT